MNDPRFEVYPRKSQDDDALKIDPHVGHAFGWRFRAANGRISAIGGEGFTRREDASRAIHDFLDDVDPEGKGTERTHAPIVDVE